jgi:predicted nuclease of restriction endonuclease-like (RecB) superfamily
MIISDDNKEYINLLTEVKQRIKSSQYEALKAVNKQLISLYWEIGALIVTRQETQGWGKSVVDQLAKDLQAEFSGISGFSARNIWRMRDFYLTYVKNEKLTPMVAEIGWTHNLVILEKCKDDLEREFYLRMTRKFGWTKNLLIHQIENQSYEKTLLSQTNFELTVSEEVRDRAKLAVKDEYTFDFLELAPEHSEAELEQALVGKIGLFLKEMGGRFSFVDRQYRIEINDNEFFIDLLMYHRELRCLVAIELKVGKFMPEYVGKMQFYLAALDDLAKLEGENPSIGIILCKSKDRTVVEYTLRDSNRPIGIATYQSVSNLPKELSGQLPSPEQIAKLLDYIE